ncbi:hypothetical protein GCM10017691_09410 [Pseudonocardia petroleophila]|uniref:GtrA family protein n=1 Tax=Pseudonocardia petroleophila TaxID=37331 RepID=A0A7G7MJA9_9PSEU|nr:GtrA family protein [Pseudonocardia petroleophila]QNG52870.1 GtrA family protein [Pseudonocardia petroleophila]
MTAVLDREPVARPSLRERHPFAVQLSRYVVAGGVGTLVNALLFLFLRTWWDLLAANLVALVLSTLVSTEVNRRFTFSGAQGHTWRVHVQTVGMVVFYAVYSSAVLLALHAVVDSPTPLLESVTVAAASVVGGAARFLILRFWVFDADPADGPGPVGRVRAYWHGHRRTVVRVGAAFLAGTALLLSSAGACDPSSWGTSQSGY